jgi:hypothetical protein
VRKVAAHADREADRDMAWVRKDPDAPVRWEAARADSMAGRGMAWATKDPDADVRRWAGV